jgi:hypothetical protein
MLAEKNVDEEMAADWAAIQDKFAVEPEDKAPADDVALEQVDEGTDEGVDTAPASLKPRDETGKFTKADKIADKAASVKADKSTPAPIKGAPAAAVAPVAENASPEASAARDINRAPSTWKPAVRETWAQLPEAVRAEIHRREVDFHNGQQQLLPDAKFGSSMKQVFEPYRMLIEAEGGTPEWAVKDFLKTAATLRLGSNQEKLNAVAGICRHYGVDLRALQQPGQSPQPQQQNPPQQLRDPRVDQLLAERERESRERVERQNRDREDTVTTWMSEADAAGNLKRPFLSDVINEVSMMVPQLQAANPSLTDVQALDAAYERAIWANPEVRQVLQTRQQTELQQQQRADSQSRVRDARRAASVNVPRRASIPSPGKPGTIDETLAETARTLGLIS